MLIAYVRAGEGLEPMAPDADLSGALWIDLCRPGPAEVARVAALGVSVPTLEDMEEIEVSSRLYREGGADVMTVVLPGAAPDGSRLAGPATFILTAARLVTVRHHAPRPFDTYPARADRSAPGCASADRVFLGLVDEIVARLADLIEEIGRNLDTLAARVFAADVRVELADLRRDLREIGRHGEGLSRIRLALLTVERALSFHAQTRGSGTADPALEAVLRAMQADIAALGVHADFLSSRISLTDDATLGLINLEQNATVRIVSVVAVLFLPPTLVASIYGMNFAAMPELDWRWGYPLALLGMLASALATWGVFKWKRWL